MYYIIYKTTNLINNKNYIGMHSTNNLDDNYLGSGKLLLQDIKKYGKHNFKREVLEILNSEEEMIKREIEIVNEYEEEEENAPEEGLEEESMTRIRR